MCYGSGNIRKWFTMDSTNTSITITTNIIRTVFDETRAFRDHNEKDRISETKLKSMCLSLLMVVPKESRR